MKRFLADTNILSEPVKPKPLAAIMDRIRRNPGRILTASPVWNELLFGCHRLADSQRRRDLEWYLHRVIEASVEILPYDSEAAAWHARERARLSLLGRTAAFVDGQIAAVAVVHDLVLVTRNVQDFLGFDGLVIEDWSR